MMALTEGAQFRQYMHRLDTIAQRDGRTEMVFNNKITNHRWCNKQKKYWYKLKLLLRF